MRVKVRRMPTAGRCVSQMGTVRPTMAVLVGWTLVALALAGCAERPRTIAEALRPAKPIVTETRVEVLTVHQPDNARPLGAESRTAAGMLALVPLMPYGTQHITPETHMRSVERLPYDLLDDIGRAVTADLAASGVARQVVYSADESSGQKGPHLYLTVREGEWRRNVTMYGLSLGGGFLWFLGAPVSYGEVVLSVEADLRDSSGKSIGKKVFSSSADYTNFLYNPHGLTERLPRLYMGVSSPLRKFVAEHMQQL